MSDFSHLGALDVMSSTTAEYTIFQISVNGISPTLILAPATEANESYFNAAMRQSGKRMKAVRAGNLNPKVLEEQRELDRKLFPRYVIQGWRDVTDAAGNAVAFSAEECEAFLRQLPNWLFDEIRMFASDAANFVDTVDIEVIAKN